MVILEVGSSSLSKITQQLWLTMVNSGGAQEIAGGDFRAIQSQGGMDLGGDPGAPLTFSVVRSLSGSWRRWLNTMVNTACERLLVSFMFVAATVLRESLGGPSVPERGVWGGRGCSVPLCAHTWPCCRCP